MAKSADVKATQVFIVARGGTRAIDELTGKAKARYTHCAKRRESTKCINYPKRSHVPTGHTGSTHYTNANPITLAHHQEVQRKRGAESNHR